jgi:uncharacterized protein (DUF2236 family)
VVIAVPGIASVMRTVVRPLPFAPRESPLRDRSADPGLFGPGSVTWRVMREPLLILAAGRALLLQTANPLVAQGAIDHSTFASDPYGRFDRTVLWVTVVVFGTRAEALTACDSVNRVHRHVQGSLPAANSTRHLRTGSVYTAADAHLLRWVHASFVDTMLTAHDALVGGLSEMDRDRFVREWDAVASLMGVPAGQTWRSAASLRAYIRRELRTNAVPSDGSRIVARTVLHPPVPSPVLRPGMDLLAFIATGLLPESLRTAYQLPWTPAHRAAHVATLAWLRSSRNLLPRRARISPVYDRAMRRSEGGLTAVNAA